MRAFVSGASGYIGSRLIASLLETDHEVVAGMRDPERAAQFSWGDQVEVVEFDIEDTSTVTAALEGCETAYYLVHSMATKGFREKDADGATGFAAACDAAGVRQIVYLSGLVPEGELSEHLASRLEVERILLEAETPATVLRAAVIIGAGSTSFEVIRGLVARLPILPMPPWMSHQVQPVSTDDVVAALVRAGTQRPAWDGHRDLGGPNRLTYRELVQIVTAELGLRRWHLPCPELPHSLTGQAIAWITGIPANTVTELIKSLRHDMTCTDPAESEATLSVHEAVRRALNPAATGTEDHGDRQTIADSDPEWAGAEPLEQLALRSLSAPLRRALGSLTSRRPRPIS